MQKLRDLLCFLAVAVILAGPALSGEALGRTRVGEISRTPLQSDHPYQGGQTLQYVVQHPGATYIKVHFSNFELAPGDRLVVSSADGRERYSFKGRGYKNLRNDFWVNSVLGDTAILTLHSAGSGGYGFDIDYYAYGIVPLVGTGLEENTESVCGTNQWTDVACNTSSYPTEVDRAKSAVVVLYNGIENCTGVKVGCPNQFLTNEHCVTSQADVDVTEVRFDYQRPDCNSGTPTFSQSYLGDLFMKDDFTLDYCLFTTQGASDTYDAAELDDRLPPIGERLYISGHPQGGPKKLSIEDDQSPTGLCQADFSPISGRGTNSDVGYYCDTTNGSSGSPVWSGVTHKVIALHHFGGCPNSGGRMDLIFPQISGLLSSCTTVCGDGVANGNEECDGADLNGASCSDIGCTSGTPTCLGDCTLDYGACGGCPTCDNDGTCESDEDCNSCSNDCPSFSGGVVCGNDVCETADGEDCLSCPADCNGKQNGRLSNRYCCGDGDGQFPVGCNDSRCDDNGNTCTTTPAGGSTCCGDLVCEGAETGANCAIDCGADPCGDTICDAGIEEDPCSCAPDCGPPPASETSCTDGNDNDCDGNADCNDSDCNGDPACPTCGLRGDSCSFNSDCCSNSCKRNGTCR